MDLTIKKRSALFCNLKVFLIFLVVYGHLIETRIDSDIVLMWQYRVIYAIHMPLFALLSGFFLKDGSACRAQMKNALKYYLLIQCAVAAGAKIAGVDGIGFIVPFWHLWYLLSLCFWAGICGGLSFLEAKWKWYGKWRVKGLFVILPCMWLACAAGETEWIGREFSLSRTIVFLPYVLAGRYLPRDISFKRYRAAGVILGLAAAGLLLMTEPVIPVKMFYQADSYRAAGVAEGKLFRVLCYLMGTGFCALFLTCMPERRLEVSKVGIDTLWIYLLHAPLVSLIRSIPLEEAEFICVAPILAVVVIAFLYEAGRWRGKLCRLE